jgi:hypothetical protein
MPKHKRKYDWSRYAIAFDSEKSCYYITDVFDDHNNVVVEYGKPLSGNNTIDFAELHNLHMRCAELNRAYDDELLYLQEILKLL